MFRKFFGETVEEQIHYLQWRVIVTLISFPLSILIMLLHIPNSAAIIGLVMLLVWGWGAVKKLFGITTIAALIANNLVVGVILFVVYLIVAYLVGVFFAFIGTGRYLYLKITSARHQEDA